MYIMYTNMFVAVSFLGTSNQQTLELPLTAFLKYLTLV